MSPHTIMNFNWSTDGINQSENLNGTFKVTETYFNNLRSFEFDLYPKNQNFIVEAFTIMTTKYSIIGQNAPFKYISTIHNFNFRKQNIIVTYL